MKNKQIAWILVALILVQDIFCAHQWRITDDGKKIEAVADSPFSLNYPGSLTDFLRQIESVKSFGKTYHELSSTLKSITKREKLDEPDIESRVKRDNSHCQRAADVKITKELFKSTYSLEVCTDYAVLNNEYVKNLIYSWDSSYILEIKKASPPNVGEVEPQCGKYFAKSSFYGEKDLNLNTFDMKLKGRFPDIEYSLILTRYLDFESRTSKGIGVFLGRMLAWISHHPYLHLMAAAYWRADGNVNEAMDCYRTATTVLRTGNHDPEYRAYMDQVVHVAAITLLNFADKPDEAALLASWLGELDQPYNDPFCRLTIIHAITADSLLSAEKESNLTLSTMKRVEYAARDYAEAIHIESQMTEKDRGVIPGWSKVMSLINDKHAALSCQLAITTELELQRHLLNEKLHFNEVYGARLKNEEQILARMAAVEDRNAQKVKYEMAKYGWNPHRDCSALIGKRFAYANNPNSFATQILCNLDDVKAYEDFLLPQRKATLVLRPPLNDTIWRLAEIFPRDKNFEKKVKGAKDSLVFETTLAKKYPKEFSKSFQQKDRYWRRTDWPNSVDCQAIVSKTDIFSAKTMPQVFISPEDKGFVVAELLTKFLGLEHNEEHPLPWNEPFCEPKNMNGNPFSPYTSLKAIFAIKGYRKQYGETKLKSTLIHLADRLMDMAEVGQRIRTLLENDIGPRWLILNLAGLYWRVKGYPSQAAHCLIESILIHPNSSDLALFQLAQVVFKVTGNKEDALEFYNMATGVDKDHPYLPWLQGRIELLASDVDGALYHLKDAMDKDPYDARITEDLLKVACSGKVLNLIFYVFIQSTKQAISSRFPTVCCSSVVQNAVCFKLSKEERCYVVDPSTYKLIYNRCNGVYTRHSYSTAPFVHIVSPFLSIFQTMQKREIPPFVDDAGAAQTIDSEELPLDYGGTEAFFAPRLLEWWSRSKNEMRYKALPVQDINHWEEEAESSLAPIPPKPLSFLWIRDKREMLQWDVKLPDSLPTPTLKQIRKGLEVFPPPRQTNNMCSGVTKLPLMLDKQLSTWVSVTAKGIDIEKYVDLRGPVPGIAGLQPVCPTVEKTGGSPILGLDHIPIFALSDQFLFYKPEKMLSDSLKSLGNDRDTIEHVAARLHTALLANAMGQHGSNVNWLLCVLSSLYWRVLGDAPKAVGCLQCALQTAPPQMRDVALVSLANIAHQAGLLHSALIAAGSALTVSPNLVAIHFTIANIYASLGDHQRALDFYYSTLALQYNFDPAKERIRAIFCHSGEKFTFNSA